jgi:hypothetical protein
MQGGVFDLQPCLLSQLMQNPDLVFARSEFIPDD